MNLMMSLAIGLGVLLHEVTNEPRKLREQHVALVVGSNRGDTSESPLQYAIGDAEKMAKALEEVDRAMVVLLREPSPSDLTKHIEDLRRFVAEERRAGKFVRVTFYYAGHADERDFHLAGGYYDMSEFKAKLLGAGADLTLALIDACRSNPGLQHRGLSRVNVPDMEVILPVHPRGAVWITSTSAGESAQESEQFQGGVFTHYWVAALRGAADWNDDGQVTLGEAYPFAAGRTQGYTAALTDDSQEANYEYRLEGARDLVVSRPTSAPSLIALPQEESTEYVVRGWPSGDLVAEAVSRPEHRIQLALPRGRFQIIRRKPDAHAAHIVHLPWGGRVALEPENFVETSTVRGETRGSRRIDDRWWLSVQGGIGIEMRAPLTARRAHVAAGWSPSATAPWLFALCVGWQRRSFDFDVGGASARLDSAQLELAALTGMSMGQFEFRGGPAIRGEVLFQKERRAEAQRFRTAGFDAEPLTLAMRIGLGARAESTLAIADRLSWTLSVASGLLGAREQGQVQFRPFLDFATGPVVVW